MFNRKLFGLNKDGSVKVWEITAHEYLCPVQNTMQVVLEISHGKLGGKLTDKVEFIDEGKQGRTPYEQAVSQAEGRIKKQMDKGYRETKEELSEVPLLPMLASDFNKVGHRIAFPCYGSVKFDGVRALAKKRDGVVTIESRTSQTYDLPRLQDILTIHMLDGDVWDGEIYKHGHELQDIVSAVKRTNTQGEIDKAQRKVDKALKTADFEAEDMSEGRADELQSLLDQARDEFAEAITIHELRSKLEFHIFDVVSDKTFQERVKDLDELCGIPVVSPLIQVTEYGYIADEEAMKAQHKWAVEQGYEGIMLRNFSGLYESGKRSADLQKYKTFVDEEFLILDVIEDKQGNGVFLLKNNVNDLEFQCVMGDLTQRKVQLQDKYKLKGKFLNVKFQTRYKGTLLPQFGVGQYIREGYFVEGQFVPYD